MDSSSLDSLQAAHDYTPKQGILFPNIPAEPTLPKGVEYMGRLGSYFVVRKKQGSDPSYRRPADEYSYYVFDSGKAVAYIATIDPNSPFGDSYPGREHQNPDLHGSGLRVVSIFLDKSVRNTGLSLSMYEWLIRNICDYLLPDDLQTHGGVSIWKRLLTDRRFQVVVFNHRTHQYYDPRPGATWMNVYKTESLRPFVTLAGKADRLIDGE